MWPAAKRLVVGFGDLGVAASGRRRRTTRLGAAAAAVGLHGIVFLLLIATAKGALFTGATVADDQGASEVVPVSLAGAPSASGGARSEKDQLQSLLKNLRTDTSSVVVEPPKTDARPSTKLDDLIAELDRAHAHDTDARGTGGHAKEDKGGKGSGAEGAAVADQRREADHSDAKSDPASGTAASSGALWGQIERCWSKLPDRSEVPVTLDIALNPDGLIAKPPKIIRPNAEAPTQKRLLSEARALEAVRSCVPYRGADLASDGKVFRVNFATSK